MNGTNTDISIIIPVYQAQKRLRICFETVKAAVEHLESSPEFAGASCEIILVDDGSTDDSKKMCDEFASEKVIVRHTGNHGVSHARNIGIELSSGKYIAFVDSDDTVEEEYLCTLYRKALDSGKDVIDMYNGAEDGSCFSGIEYISLVTLQENTHVWGKLFKREAIVRNKVVFPEGLSIGEDMLFLLDLALKKGDSRDFYVITEGGYNYYDNEEGAMKSAFKESYANQLICWKKAEEKMTESGYAFSEDVKDRLSVIQIMNSMLVAGKIACMSREDKKSADADMINAILSTCQDLIEHALERKRAFSKLPGGYKIKVSVFRMNAKLYLGLYGLFKA